MYQIVYALHYAYSTKDKKMISKLQKYIGNVFSRNQIVLPTY